MIVAQCDFCLRTIPQDQAGAWLLVQRVTVIDASDRMPPWFRQAFGREEDPPAPSGDPLAPPGRLFCSEPCAIRFLTSGRSLAEMVGPLGEIR